MVITYPLVFELHEEEMWPVYVYMHAMVFLSPKSIPLEDWGYSLGGRDA